MSGARTGRHPRPLSSWFAAFLHNLFLAGVAASMVAFLGLSFSDSPETALWAMLAALVCLGCILLGEHPPYD